MASISPRRYASGTVAWRVMFRVDGKQKQESFIEREGAEQFCALVDRVGGDAALKVLEARRNNEAAKPTLREWTELYLSLESGLLTGIEPGTRKGYEREAERSFLPILGEYPIDAITREDIGRWLAWQESQPSKSVAGQNIAAKTVRNYHGLLSSILAAAVEHGHRTDNPAYKIRLSAGLRRDPVFLSPEEVLTIIAFVPEYYKTFVWFLAATGARWGEATAVTWEDFSFTTSPAVVRINKAWKKGDGAPVLGHPKSRKARRTISLFDDFVTVLERPKDSALTDLAFPGPQGKGHLWMGRFRSTVWGPAITKAMDKELCAELGLAHLERRPRIHDLRHSHASWLIARGMPLPYIQARLGHEKITTTVDVYGHLVPDAHAQMADAIGRAFPVPIALAPRHQVVRVLEATTV